MTVIHGQFPGRGDATQPPSDGSGTGLNDRLTKLETRLETILPTLATKGDVAEAKASTVMWLAGVIAASTALIIAVLAFMLNRAVPVSAPTQPQTPIVIYAQQPPALQPQSSSAPQAGSESKRGLSP